MRQFILARYCGSQTTLLFNKDEVTATEGTTRGLGTTRTNESGGSSSEIGRRKRPEDSQRLKTATRARVEPEDWKERPLLIFDDDEKETGPRYERRQ